MGKRYSRPCIQAWISRESPEGGCVIINDTSSQTRLLEEILKQKRTVTSYEGYLVNEEDNLDPGVLTDHHSDKNSKSVESFPIEIVDLPGEPDGKQVEVHFVKEGNIYDASCTSVKPEDIDCGVSIRSMTSDKQQWSFSLYNFEDNGRISKQDLTNLVKSIYDALGKSMDKANKKNSKDTVKKVKVHISLSKEKTREIRRGSASIVPRREVVVGADDQTLEAEKLQQLKITESCSSQDGVARRKTRRKDACSTVQVLNNDLGNGQWSTLRCKCCAQKTKKKSLPQTENNCNLLADTPNLPVRRKTEPGGCLPQGQNAGHGRLQLTERKNKSRSHRRPEQTSASPGVHMFGHSSPRVRISPVVHNSENSSPAGRSSGYNSPVHISTPRNDVPFGPTYAYHAEENKYVYMHAAPRQTPFEEPKHTGKHRCRGKHRRQRDSGENPSGMPPFSGKTSVVHRHEHVHHHYHHYGEKR